MKLRVDSIRVTEPGRRRRRRVRERRAVRPGRRARHRPAPHHPQRSRGRRARPSSPTTSPRSSSTTRTSPGCSRSRRRRREHPAVGVRPWLVLVALADGEFTDPRTRRAAAHDHRGRRQEPARPRRLVGVGARAGGGRARRRERARSPRSLAASRSALLSRLVCPRRPRPDTHYTGFLVPAFEHGRLAGLQEAVPRRHRHAAGLGTAATTQRRAARLPQLRLPDQRPRATSSRWLRGSSRADAGETVGIRDMRVDRRRAGACRTRPRCSGSAARCAHPTARTRPGSTQQRHDFQAGARRTSSTRRAIRAPMTRTIPTPWSCRRSTGAGTRRAK